MAYTFANVKNTIAKRDDGAHVPWNPQANQPLDIGGLAGAMWREAGSPIPEPYVAPPPTPDEIRMEAFKADTDRQNIVDAVKDATPQQIKTYITNNVTDLASARAMLIRLALLVAATIRS